MKADRTAASAADQPAQAPRQRDSDRTQKAILAAATAEFAEFGLGGARADRIAERAGVNKRLIFYYFESKENLFSCVLQEAYRGIRNAEAQLHLTGLVPVDAVRKLVEFTWNYYLEHPEFIKLLNSENLHRARHISGSAAIQDVNLPLVQTLGEILERGRTQGVFRGGVDSVQLYISIAGLAYFYLSNNATLSVIFGRDLHATKALNERLSHITEVVLGYLVRS